VQAGAGEADAQVDVSLGKTRLAPEKPSYGFDEPACAVAETIAEEVGALDRCERPTTTDVVVGDFAFIEPDWDEPRLVWGPELHLLDRQN
jgi:hypothetical protein